MTLHWWMHWFWVTVQFLIILGNPLPSTTVDPQGHTQGQFFTGASTFVATASAADTEESSSSSTAELARSSSSRVAKAIEVYPQSNTAAVFERQTTTEPVNSVESLTEDLLNGTSRANNSRVGNVGPATTNWTAILQREVERSRNAGLKKDSKITRISLAGKANRSMYEGKTEQRETEKTLMQASGNRNASVANEEQSLAVLPLHEEDSRFRLVLNKTGSASSLLTASSGSSGSSNSAVTLRSFNRSDDKVAIDGLAEHQIFATAASILEAGASEPTRLSRARSAFSSGFQKDQTQADHRPPDYNDVNNGKERESINEENTASRSVDIAAITGSCMATVVLLSTMGSVGFIMYRRRYLNPPQTLNSDKCSNPDSSGYIDDSTIRDNSEEMYSLDNDSFLNSLEAMTIQNYWTDSVKHTKL